MVTSRTIAKKETSRNGEGVDSGITHIPPDALIEAELVEVVHR